MLYASRETNEKRPPLYIYNIYMFISACESCLLFFFCAVHVATCFWGVSSDTEKFWAYSWFAIS